jgi:choline dehydrogenase-like flavoprotein
MTVGSFADLIAGESFDVLIVGAGAAGITIARVLGAAGRRVALIEGGEDQFSAASQDCYMGSLAGHSYYPLDICRLRYLGGSTNHWNGLCHPLLQRDFQQHSRLPLPGWPIDKTALDPYTEAALSIVEYPAFNPPEAGVLGLDGIERLGFQTGKAVRMGQKYRDELTRSEAVHVYLKTSLVDLHYGPDGAVESVTLASLDAPGQRVAIRAKAYVLAMGGVDNARFLLWANRAQPKRPAMEWVGRCFMEHPHVAVGEFASSLDHVGFWFLSPSSGVLNRLGANNICFRLEGGKARPPSGNLVHRAWDAVRTLARYGIDVATWGQVVAMSEQLPNPDSRVTLQEGKTDRFGIPLSCLDWRLTDQDIRSIAVAARDLAERFAATPTTRMRLEPWVLDPTRLSDHVSGGYHHMGTTRMAASPSDGVVDSDCRVFGTRNLYVGGSSVFSTGGFVNPTFTILQLSLRLAETLLGRS